MSEDNKELSRRDALKRIAQISLGIVGLTALGDASASAGDKYQSYSSCNGYFSTNVYESYWGHHVYRSYNSFCAPNYKSYNSYLSTGGYGSYNSYSSYNSGYNYYSYDSYSSYGYASYQSCYGHYYSLNQEHANGYWSTDQYYSYCP